MKAPVEFQKREEKRRQKSVQEFNSLKKRMIQIMSSGKHYDACYHNYDTLDHTLGISKYINLKKCTSKTLNNSMIYIPSYSIPR